jgi:hypothetical protein
MFQVFQVIFSFKGFSTTVLHALLSALGMTYLPRSSHLPQYDRPSDI